MNSIKDHFDKASRQYAKSSNFGLWKYIRSQESRALIQMLPAITDNTTALDLGCGAGFYSNILQQLGIKNITCVDFSANMLGQINNSHYKKIHANIEEFIITEKYDIILCAGALEFVNEPQRVFKNVTSALGKNACFILLYPEKSFFGKLYKYYHKMHGFFIKLYSEDDMALLAREAGLKRLASAKVFPFTKIIKLA